VSGEREGDRKTLEGLVRDQVAFGIKPALAERKARDAMLERDRRLEKQGKR